MTHDAILVKCENISKRFQSVDDTEAPLILNQINLEVQAGQTVAVVGPSGSGKSTLLNIIGLLDQPTQGKIYFEGKDASQLSESEQAKLRNDAIGWVFQSHHLLPQCTVVENVLLPALASQASVSGEIRERAIQLLERVGLSHRLSHRPGQLSGGEQQRVAVVRALINSPRLLLADEPTGALDQSSSDNLVDLLLELNQETQVALLVVTHAMEVAQKMDHVLCMNDGKLESAGATA